MVSKELKATIYELCKQAAARPTNVGRMIKKVLIPRYWNAKGGRGADHLADVMASARQLAGRKLTPRERLTIALHDIGVGRAGFTRDEHPVAALDALSKDVSLRRLRGQVDREMRDAIRYHMKDEYSKRGILSDLHKLLLEADEGAPVWGEKRIEKPVKYWLDGRNKNMPLTTPENDVAKYVLGVLKKKVSAFNSGQAPFTERYVRTYSDQIRQASEWANNLKEGDVLKVIQRMKANRGLS